MKSLAEKVHEIDKALAVEKVTREKDIFYIEKARELQAKEYERRLHDLNGEAGRLRDMQAKYVPREVFETRKDEMDKAINELKESRANAAGRQTIIAVVVPVLISLGFLLLNNFLK